MPKVLYLDCFSGISGDMFLGALIDLGWGRDRLRALPDLLGLSGISVEIDRVSRAGLSAVSVRIIAEEEQPARRLGEILKLIGHADLPDPVGNRAETAFRLMAEVEASIHGIGVEEVHFHEVGAADAVCDVVGAFLAIHELGIEKIYSSPIPLARGWTECAHGHIPLPAPAVVRLLQGLPVNWRSEPFEFTTPTGALLVKSLADAFEPPHGMLEGEGLGAGKRDLSQWPNVLRVMLIDERWHQGQMDEEVVEFRAVIDDMTPEELAYVKELLLAKGALDVWSVPVQMKKSRPGFELVCLGEPWRAAELGRLILEESSTIGVRFQAVERRILPRKSVVLETPVGPIVAKEILRPSGRREIVPEYESCRQAAKRNGMPIGQVFRMVRRIGEGNGAGGDGHG